MKNLHNHISIAEEDKKTKNKMTTTNLYSGIGEKNSSRVLKPPGGGHSNIFGEPDACPIKARPKYNQQNSSNLSCVMGTVDANEKVVDAAPHAPEPVSAPAPASVVAPAAAAAAPPSNGSQESAAVKPAPPTAAPVTHHNHNSQQGSGDSGKPRVPPGGFSSGFW